MSGSEPGTISLLGAPQGKDRARPFLPGSHIGDCTPEKTLTYENVIGDAVMQKIRRVVTGPIAVALSKFSEGS